MNKRATYIKICIKYIRMGLLKLSKREQIYFTKAYENISSLEPGYYMNHFIFNGHTIRIFLSTNPGNNFLVLICNINNHIIIKDCPFSVNSSNVTMNKSWKKEDMWIAKNLMHEGNFDRFFMHLNNILINSSFSSTGKSIIKKYIDSSKSNYTYFKTIKRNTNMSDYQRKKGYEVLGKFATDSIESKHCTIVFTDSIFNKKEFNFNIIP